MDKKAQDLTVVLFGNSSAVGDENALLGKPTADNPDFSMIVPVPQKISGRSLSIISLFDLQDRDRYQDSVDHTIARLVTENKIHAFIFVLQLGKLTDTDKVGLEWLQSKFGEGVLRFVMILFTYEREEDCDTIIDDLKKNSVLVELLRKCGDRYHTCSKNMNNQSEMRKLLELIDHMVSENNHRCYTADLYNSASKLTEDSQDSKSPQRLSERLNLVLCGSDGAVKSSISDLILGQREPSPGSSSVCVRREGAVCGRLVTLVEMPALYNTQLSEEEVMQESLRCVSLCDPGVHAFLLVVPEGRLTDKDKGELEKVQMIFGSRFNNHLMFIINADSQQEAVKLDDAIKSFTETYNRQICILDSNKVLVLLEQAEQLVIQNSGCCYTTAMYLGAQVETQMKYKSKIEELQNTISFLRGELKNRAQESSPGTGDLRVVLLGKTGVGKSAAGNTILEKKAFRELLSFQSVTSVCQRDSAEVRGRQISVIDTPGLFDTDIPNEEIRKEIVKCITMAAPGPHVFLLVLSLGRFTKEEEEAVKMIQDLFGDESRGYTMVLFTRGDDLQKMGKTIEDLIKNSDRRLQNLLHQCGNRYHVFNNSLNDHSQVTDLLEKIDSMVTGNGGSCYTNEMFQQVEEALKEEQERIQKEREEEIEREKEELKAKHEAEIEKLRSAMEDKMRNLAKERREKEEEFLKREVQIKNAINMELKKEMANKLREQQETLNQEIERKKQAYKKKMMKDLEAQKEKYEREKESIRERAEKGAREQAEKEFCAELEKEVAKAKEDGYEKGKSDFRRSLSYASWLAHYGSRLGSVMFPLEVVGGTVGGLVGGIVDAYILFKNHGSSFKFPGYNKMHD